MPVQLPNLRVARSGGCVSWPRPDEPTNGSKHVMGDTQRQINQLREQVETLMRERVTPAVTDVAGRADRAISAARKRAETLSGQVEERPLLAILVAAGIGYLVGRFLST